MKNKKHSKTKKIFVALISSIFGLSIFWFIYPLMFKANPLAMFYYYYYSFILPFGFEEPAYNFSEMMAENKKIVRYNSELDYPTILQCTKQTKPSSTSLELSDISSYRLPTSNYAVSVIVVSDENDYKYTSLTSFIAEIDKKFYTCKIIKQHAASMG
jgi:hypothetical protein